MPCYELLSKERETVGKEYELIKFSQSLLVCSAFWELYMKPECAQWKRRRERKRDREKKKEEGVGERKLFIQLFTQDISSLASNIRRIPVGPKKKTCNSPRTKRISELKKEGKTQRSCNEKRSIKSRRREVLHKFVNTKLKCNYMKGSHEKSRMLKKKKGSHINNWGLNSWADVFSPKIPLFMHFSSSLPS